MSVSKLLRSLSPADSRSIPKAKVLHSKFITSGLPLSDTISSNHLLSFYSKCGLTEYARNVFDQMPQKNLISFSILISCYSNSGLTDRSIASFRSMLSEGFAPNDFIYVSVLSACAAARAARTGKEIHARIYRVEEGTSSSFVSNSLLNLYAKCGLTAMARKVFDGILIPSLVSWGSIISACCQCGESKEALSLFSRARREVTVVNEFLLASALSACSGIGDLRVAEQVHCLVVKSGFGLDRYVEAGVVDVYVRCRELELANRAFSESGDSGLVTWAAIIGGFAQQGQGKKAMGLFREFHSAGLRPNDHVFPSALVACSCTALVNEGMQVHSLILKMGFKIAFHVGNALMDFYAKCGLLEESTKVFTEMEERDIVAWNSIIARRIEKGDTIGTIDLLRYMLVEGKDPDLYTYSSILGLCADLPAVGWGKQTHCRAIKPTFDVNVVVGSALIDMYAKCGRLNDARKVFDRLPSKNLVSWNGMLDGYAQHGFGKEALEIFEMMERERVEPNDITFIGVLSACVHAGLVEQGQYYFDMMIRSGIIPRIDHFACMVDLFARAGLTERAYKLIRSMPMEPNKVIWRSLLAGCRTHGDLEMGSLAARHVLKIDPEDTAASVMISGIYANSGVSVESAEVRERERRGMKKVPGCSWIEMKCRNHRFTVGDVELSHGDPICEALNCLAAHMVDLRCDSNSKVDVVSNIE